MPKKVDHEARRSEIAQALWRIASTRGLDGVSLRDVAAEADISLGRLQHYFRTKDEMLLFALRHINVLADRRIRERLGALAPAAGQEPPPRTVLRECLAGMLPLDERSRIGTLVGAAYFARAIHDERLREEAREGIPKLAELFVSLLRSARERGELAEERALDPHTEAMLLISLVDGLTAYTLLGVQTGEEALHRLDAHLDRLFRSES
ncbi:TetR/AcrR family transcriptional regulator [Streptomyces ficellus]|uniref:TetR family transcriptional regulator n=1 Tax=Streptomyces ficellus TaxID=1977088 RepID=A0A6I6F7A9_9ACTN|nr:TetR family transcriptional regulator C-terminal domain-containing protein [Streptomyces ficellus]QGV76897.1 TetR family transcriptional regulator [Streptomyces ficellus]